MDLVLVDGHNALYALGLAGGRDHEGERRALLARVAAALPEALVYFDGRGAPTDLPRVFRQEGVKVHYCADREADDEIFADVAHATDPRRLTVVTNDRELAARCRRAGALVVRVEDALGRAPARVRTSAGRRRRRPRVPRADALPESRPLPPLRDGDAPLRPDDFDLPDVVDLG